MLARPESASRSARRRRSSETVGRMWLMSTGGGIDQQVAERGAEPVGVVGGDRGVDGDAAQARRQRRRAVEVAARRLEALASVVRGVAVAAVLEHPREQLLDRLLGPELLQLLSAPGSISRDFSSSSEAIRTRNSVATSSSSSPSRSRCST